MRNVPPIVIIKKKRNDIITSFDKCYGFSFTELSLLLYLTSFTTSLYPISLVKILTITRQGTAHCSIFFMLFEPNVTFYDYRKSLNTSASSVFNPRLDI